MISINFVTFSQTLSDTICITKKQAQKIVNTLDSLDNMANVLKVNNHMCDLLVQDLQKELSAYKDLDTVKTDAISDMDSLITAQDYLINDQYDLLESQERKIKKQKRRFKIFGGAYGGVFLTLLLLVLL